MCYYGLAYHEVAETVVSKIANKLLTNCSQINHAYIDIPFEGKNLLNIGHVAREKYGGDIIRQDKELINIRMAKFRETLITPIRERYWLAKLLSIDEWPCIFICGDDHVDSIHQLILDLDDNMSVGTIYLSIWISCKTIRDSTRVIFFSVMESPHNYKREPIQ
jgi:hypothetical protein